MTDQDKEYTDWLKSFFDNLLKEKFHGTLAIKIRNGYISHIDKPIQSVDVPRFEK